MKNQVVVGMSGGVDSTIAAYLLQKNGYKVAGLTMKIWSGVQHGVVSTRAGCYGPSEFDDIASASLACEKLEIPHFIIDLTREYEQTVLTNFRNEYQNGRTPNPCVLCNYSMKFGTLLEKAHDAGIDFDFFATGHYARITRNVSSQRFELRKASDLHKDQSYFLYQLDQSQLSNSLFPLGKMTKKEVKELAHQSGFHEYAVKSESQDFLDNSIQREFIFGDGDQTGEIVNMDGEVIGHHLGISKFTVGQRKGLQVAGKEKPWYVIRIESDKNRIIVGPKEYLLVKKVMVSSANWVSISKPTNPTMTRARVRSRQMETECRIVLLPNDTLEAEFTDPLVTVAPGQSIVFYDEDLVLGGGIIQSVQRVQSD